MDQPAKQAIVVVANDGYWGVGETLALALQHANVRLAKSRANNSGWGGAPYKVHVRAYNCSTEEIRVSTMDGSTSYPAGATSIDLGLFSLTDVIPDSQIIGAAREVIEDYEVKAKKEYPRTLEVLSDIEEKLDEIEWDARDKAKAEAEAKAKGEKKVEEKT